MVGGEDHGLRAHVIHGPALIDVAHVVQIPDHNTSGALPLLQLIGQGHGDQTAVKVGDVPAAAAESQLEHRGIAHHFLLASVQIVRGHRLHSQDNSGLGLLRHRGEGLRGKGDFAIFQLHGQVIVVVRCVLQTTGGQRDRGTVGGINGDRLARIRPLHSRLHLCGGHGAAADIHIHIVTLASDTSEAGVTIGTAAGTPAAGSGADGSGAGVICQIYRGTHVKSQIFTGRGIVCNQYITLGGNRTGTAHGAPDLAVGEGAVKGGAHVTG